MSSKLAQLRRSTASVEAKNRAKAELQMKRIVEPTPQEQLAAKRQQLVQAQPPVVSIPDPNVSVERVKRKKSAPVTFTLPSSTLATILTPVPPPRPLSSAPSSASAPAHIFDIASTATINLADDRSIERLFYETVLLWEFNTADSDTDSNDSTHINNTIIDTNNPSAHTRFSSAADYQSFFRPLLLQDFHSQLSQSYDTNTHNSQYSVRDIQCASFDDGHYHSDSFYTVQLLHCFANTGPSHRALNETDRMKIHRGLREWMNGDLAVLRHHTSNSHSVDCYAVVVVDQFDTMKFNESPSSAASFRLRAYLPHHSTNNDSHNHQHANSATITRIQQIWRALHPTHTNTSSATDKASQSPSSTGSFSLVRLDSPITTMREFMALMRVESLSLLPHLLQPPKSAVTDTHTGTESAMNPQHPLSGSDIGSALIDKSYETLPERFRDFQSTSLNEFQYSAVKLAAMKSLSVGLTLLQGPPGTGKTKTVVSLLNSLHLRSYQSHYASLIEHLLYVPVRKSNSGESASMPISIDDSVSELVQQRPPILPKPRFLVCAPSNAGVDEIIARVLDVDPHTVTESKGGFLDGSLDRYKPDIVRIGQSEAIREEIKSKISLDALVDGHVKMTVEQLRQRQKHAATVKNDTEKELNKLIVIYHQRHSAAIRELHANNPGSTIASVSPHEVVEPSFLSHVAHLHERLHLSTLDYQRCQLLLSLYTPSNNDSSMLVLKPRDRMVATDRLRLSHLNEAHIIFSTLSGAGLDLLSDLDQPFQSLVIDEAAQSTELSVLVAMRHNVRHCVLIGDPRQLPATVFTSRELIGRRYIERSLFERCQNGGQHVMTLLTQYRMHREIRLFPSKHFYDNKLRDGENILSLQYVRAYHSHPMFAPFLVFDTRADSMATLVDGYTLNAMKAKYKALADASHSKSSSNFIEAAFIVRLCEMLVCLYHREVASVNIGVISFYQQQRKLIQLLLSDSPANINNRMASIEVSTVDGFQGREKDIIIVSTVRGMSRRSKNSALGFVSDIRRMNVALTRGKYCEWVCGDLGALSQGSESWRALMQNANERKCIRNVHDIRQIDPTFAPFAAGLPVNNLIQAEQQQHQQHGQHQLHHQQWVMPPPLERPADAGAISSMYR